MAASRTFQPRGVIPAALLPFRPDGAIDEAAFRGHLTEVGSVPGISALCVNGHASEVHACDSRDQRKVLALARATLPDLPLVCGIPGTDSRSAARAAATAAAEGADALLIFPPACLALGHMADPRARGYRLHLEHLAGATDLPFILFHYPESSGLALPTASLASLAEAFPSIVAIKDWCNDPLLHERHIRLLHGLSRRVAVLSTHSAWLMPSLLLGCDGLLSGAGSVIAPWHVALWEAVQRDDLASARRWHERIRPVAAAFYREPLGDMHVRMKEALVMLGRLPGADVRAPLARLEDDEREQLAGCLIEAGLLPAEGQAGTGGRA